MTAPDASRVGFGLRAAAVAMKARAGHRVAFAEIVDLSGYWLAAAPGDDRVGAALARFLVEVQLDAPAAGSRLLDFLGLWVAPAAAEARTAERIIETAGAEMRDLPEWTRRADCGVD